MQPEPVVQLIEEKRLVGTLITGRPSADAFIITTAVALFSVVMTLLYWSGPQWLADLLPAVQAPVFKQGQLWRVFTATFVHADIQHLLSNIYMLWIFGFFVFGYFGFSVFPVASFFLAGVVNALAILTYAPETHLLGASGLVYILGGFWLTLYPLVQRQYSVGSRLLRVIGIALVIFLPSTFVPTTSYRAHAIGFSVGVLMGLWYFRKHREQIRAFETYKISFV